MVIDLTTKELAIKSLLDILNIKGGNISHVISKLPDDISDLTLFYVDKFLKNNYIDINKVLNQPLDVAFLHVTTNNDNCLSIKKYGLLNLREAIIKETSLNKFFSEIGIVIDIYNEKIYYQNKFYDISEKSASENVNVRTIRTKLYRDFQVCGFLHSPNPLGYSGEVEKSSELLRTLSYLIRFDLNEKWISKVQTYVLKCHMPINSFKNSGAICVNEDHFDEDELKSSLFKTIIQLLLIAIKKYHSCDIGDAYCFLKDNLFVPPEKITILKSTN